MDYQTQKIKELLALIEQNPTLPGRSDGGERNRL